MSAGAVSDGWTMTHWSAAEDGVVLVLAAHRVAELAALPQAVEVAAEVPAARPLAQVAADGALVAELRAARPSADAWASAR